MFSSLSLLVLLFGTTPGAADFFRVQVIDQQTGRGVPLIELRTVNDVCWYTDSAGLAAIREPGLMNRNVFFHVQGHGYEFPKDGFGYRGTRLRLVPGREATLKIKRINIAERLYRVTGGGIYRDSILVGKDPPIEQPLLNGRVLGSDSVQNVVYQGRIYWFWGDTNRPSYPLGNFHVPGATSRLPSDGGLSPDQGVDLSYFVGPDGFAKSTAEMPGEGPTWIDALVTLQDRSGHEQLLAAYAKIQPPLKVYERGLVRFDESTDTFEKLVQFADDARVYPSGHTFKQIDEGIEYVYFANPYPLLRVRAEPGHVQDLSEYEAYSCFLPGSRRDAYELDRDRTGTLRYGWKKDTIATTRELENELIQERMIVPREGILQTTDANSGKTLQLHRGSVYWNAYRKCWIMIAVEIFGTSTLGEVWYAEAPHPTGPWRQARKIVTHDNYSFYNPKQHPMFDQQGGRIIFFEGTYTNTFSGNPDRTPRYEYNQIMYRLDLGHPRLQAP